MSGSSLIAIALRDRENEVSGTSVFAGIEGSRPMLMEIQALTAPTNLGTPRRAVIGWDSNRLAMIIAVLEARCGVSISNQDVYLNVAGGLRIKEPAADLAVAAALISSITRRSVSSGFIIFGEIGLSGEIRPVNQTNIRLKEGSKLGFTGAICPLELTKNTYWLLDKHNMIIFLVLKEQLFLHHQYISLIVLVSTASLNSSTTCVSWNTDICSRKGDAIQGEDSLFQVFCLRDSASQLELNIFPHILHLKLHKLLNL